MSKNSRGIAKKTMAIFLVLIMIISMLPSAAATNSRNTENSLEMQGAIPFTDVSDNSWYYENVVYVYENEVMIGTGNNRFEPEITVTRAQFVKAIANMAAVLGYDTSGYLASDVFEDVKAGTYYDEPMGWAKHNDILVGTSSTEAEPNEAVTREQMATFLYRYVEFLGYEYTRSDAEVNYSDKNSVNTWAGDAVTALTKAGIFNGIPENGTVLFKPQEASTRAQMAALLNRLLDGGINPPPVSGDAVTLVSKDGVPSLGQAGDGKITGLEADTVYALYTGDVKSIVTSTADGEITGLDNSKSYFVRLAGTDATLKTGEANILINSATPRGDVEDGNRTTDIPYVETVAELPDADTSTIWVSTTPGLTTTATTTDANATVKIVKYEPGTTAFTDISTKAAWDGSKTAIEDGDIFIIMVTAEEGETTHYYKIVAKTIEYEAKSCVGDNMTLTYREAGICQELPGKSALVIVLHGRSVSGDDNVKQLLNEALNNTAGYLSFNEIKSILLAPQCTLDKTWDLEESRLILEKCIAEAIENNPYIDTNRIYIMGASLGGRGVWTMLDNNTDLFAAAMAVDSDPTAFGAKAENVSKTPICVIVGDPGGGAIKNAPQFVEEMKAAGGTVRYDVMKKDHVATCVDSFLDDANLDWVFSHTRESGGDEELWFDFEKPDVAEGEYAVNANGQWIGFGGGPAPYAEGATYMLPLEAVGAALGCTVENTSGDTWTVTYCGVTATLTVGSNAITVGSSTRTIAQAVAKEGGNVYVPLNFWDQAFSTDPGAKTMTDGQYLYVFLRVDEPYYMMIDGVKYKFDWDSFTDPDGVLADMSYRVTKTHQELEGKDALVIFLHGGSYRTGNENALPLKLIGVHDIADYLYDNDMKATLLVPQCGAPTWADADKTEFLAKWIEDYINNSANNIDPDRVYLLGVSAGGDGTWALTANNPGLFAAAMPVAAAGRTIDTQNNVMPAEYYPYLAQTPLMIITGENDMDPDEVEDHYNEITALGGEARFYKLKDADHPQTCEYAFGDYEEYTPYSGTASLDWLFSHTLGVRLVPMDGVPSLGQAGDGKIAGLDAETVYALYTGGVKSIVTSTADGEITGLTNGTSYFVRLAGSDATLKTGAANILINSAVPRGDVEDGNRTTAMTPVTDTGALADAPASKIWVGSEVGLTTSVTTTDGKATVKIVKYAFGADLTGIDTDPEWDSKTGTIEDGDIFVIKVTAEDGVTTNYYKVAVEKAIEYAKGTYTAENDVTLQYRQAAICDDSNSETKPALVILLHGGSGRGTDNTAQLKTEGLNSIAGYLEFNNKESILVVPQCDTANSAWTTAKGVTALNELIKRIASENNIDEEQIYLMGASLGGGLLWYMLAEETDLFAAAMAVDNTTAEYNYANTQVDAIKETPVLALVGNPGIGSSTISKTLVDALNDAGGTAKRIVLEGLDHIATCQSGFLNDENLAWVFSHTKATVSDATLAYGTVINGATPGTVTLTPVGTTAELAAARGSTFKVSSTTGLLTEYAANDAANGATAKIMKYAAGETQFADKEAWTNETQINSGDIFVIKVTAADGITTNYYKFIANPYDTTSYFTARGFNVPGLTFQPTSPDTTGVRFEPTEVFENVYFIGSSWVCSMIFDIHGDGSELVLWDALNPNYDDLNNVLFADMKKLGLDPENITTVFLSHGHGDHYGVARFLQDMFDATVYIQKADSFEAADGKIYVNANAAVVSSGLTTRPIIGGETPNERGYFYNTEVAEPGGGGVTLDTITVGDFTFTFMHTPGHTAGSTSFFVNVKSLEDGSDHILTCWGGTSAPSTDDSTKLNSVTAYKASAQRYREYINANGVDSFLSIHPFVDYSTDNVNAVRNTGTSAPLIRTAAEMDLFCWSLRTYVELRGSGDRTFANQIPGYGPKALNWPFLVYMPQNLDNLMYSDKKVAAEIFDDVYLVGTGKDACLIFDTAKGIVIVDAMTGQSDFTDIVLPALQGFGLDPTDIKAVMLTSGRADKTGFVQYVKSTYGAEIYMNNADSDISGFTADKNLADFAGSDLDFGGFTFNWYSTPGQTPGTMSFVVGVKVGGVGHTAACWGGTTMPDTEEALQNYSASINAFLAESNAAGADAIISTNPYFDFAVNKADYLDGNVDIYIGNNSPASLLPFNLDESAFIIGTDYVKFALTSISVTAVNELNS